MNVDRVITMLIGATDFLALRCLTVSVALRSWRGLPEDLHELVHMAAARLVANPRRCGEDGCRADLVVDLLRPHRHEPAPAPAHAMRGN